MSSLVEHFSSKRVPYSSDWLAKVAVKDNYDSFARIRKKPKADGYIERMWGKVEVSDSGLVKSENNEFKERKSKRRNYDSKAKILIPLEFKSLKKKPQNSSAGKSTLTLPSIHPTMSPDKPAAVDITGAIAAHRYPKNAITLNPPIASVMDFHQTLKTMLHEETMKDKHMAGALDATRSPLVAGDEAFSDMKSPSSRLSNAFMLQYLGVGTNYFKNSVTSMRVRPILPPISGSKNNSPKHLAVKSEKATFKRNIPIDENEHLPNYCIYHPLPSHTHHAVTSNGTTPSNLEDLSSNSNDDFSRVVRWKSKARYCHKPAMFRRITSPTIGEKALRKNKDQKASKKSLKLPLLADLHANAVEKHEPWHRPRTNNKNDTSKEKLRTNHDKRLFSRNLQAQKTTLNHLLTSRAKQIMKLNGAASNQTASTRLKPLWDNQ